MKKQLSLFLLVTTLLLFTNCDTLKNKTQPIRTKVNIEKPRLAVVISVDQMRYEYLERFGDQFEAGFRRLLDDGAVMRNANYQHAITGTAPGHATISTGCHPSQHGIMANNYYTPGAFQLAYAVTDTTTTMMGMEDPTIKVYGSSPRKLLVPALGDWLKGTSAESKVYAVAFKDRSATLMGGFNADRAFWFDQPSTRMVSSTFYKSAFPEWTKYYIGKELMKTPIEKGWQKMRKEEDYSASREDDFPYELGTQRTTFPHTLHSFMPPAATASYEARKGMLLWNSPMGDAYALEFAKAIIENEKLGMDEIQDVLFVGCSVADKIGHQYGPHSQEVQDYYLRLDQYLGNFFAYLDERIGKDNYYVGLTADHGVVPIPEYSMREGIDARRVTSREFAIHIDSIEARLQRKMGLKRALIRIANYQGFTLDYTETADLGIAQAEVQRIVAAAIDTLPYVYDVFTPAELTDLTSTKQDVSFFRNNYRTDRGVELKVKFEEHVLVGGGSNGTSHGTVYEYDTHIPMIFMGPQVKAGSYDQNVGVVDFAPTMARMIDAPIPGSVDGRPQDFIFMKKVIER